jgi:hypothetical protein
MCPDICEGVLGTSPRRSAITVAAQITGTMALEVLPPRWRHAAHAPPSKGSFMGFIKSDRKTPRLSRSITRITAQAHRSC